MKRVFTQTFGVVGAILERDGKILLVKEAQGVDYGKWSHPAGWIDVGEDPIEAVKRETKEESGFDFKPTHILGIYSLLRKDKEKELGAIPHAIKIIFIGDISKEQSKELYEDISETKWFTPEAIYQMDSKTLRDVDIKEMVRAYFKGKRYSIDLLIHTEQT